MSENVVALIPQQEIALINTYLTGQSDDQFWDYYEEHEITTEADVTVQTCWNADRLELTRVGIRPAEFLCTEAAKGHDQMLRTSAVRRKASATGPLPVRHARRWSGAVGRTVGRGAHQ